MLLEALPQADSDLTIFLCKALARMKDKRAVEPLLGEVETGPAAGPGARYIPDVLAAIGDRSVVPASSRRCGNAASTSASTLPMPWAFWAGRRPSGRCWILPAMTPLPPSARRRAGRWRGSARASRVPVANGRYSPVGLYRFRVARPSFLRACHPMVTRLIARALNADTATCHAA